MSALSDTPTIHRITPENPPQFPCWLWDGNWWSCPGPGILINTQDTHWCQSETRPTAAPDVGHEADLVTKSDTPRTDALDCELHNPRVLEDRYSAMRDHARQLERELGELRADVESWKTNPQALHAHCLRYMTKEQVAHLFGERHTTDINQLRAELAAANAQAKQYAVEAGQLAAQIAAQRTDRTEAV